jgi:hypothetical protein
MKTTNPAPLETTIQPPQNEEASPFEAEVGNREAGGWASLSSSSSSPSRRSADVPTISKHPQDFLFSPSPVSPHASPA